MEYYLPKLNLSRLKKLILLLVFILGIFSSGYLFGLKGYKADLAKGIKEVKIERSIPYDKDVDFSLFWKVWDILGNSYFDKTKLAPSKMVYGAIQGMVAAVGDPYTVFLPPTENKVVQEDLKGTFEGIGIQIGYRGKQLAVIAPLPGTPAEKAGIKSGDYIIGIKDEAKNINVGTVGISLPEAVQMIRGKKGTKVTLALTRDEVTEPIIVDVAREDIKVESVMLTFVGENKDIAHLRLLKFGGETEGEWNKKITEILKSNSKGIILDLRSNPGGYLQGAVDIASDFLKTDTVAVMEENATGARNEFKTNRVPRLEKYKMVILMDKGSASASEILAGALREEGKYKLVGDTSFGKGTIQEPKQLEDGAGLHITIARWLTPKGNWVHEKGLDPDVKISDNPETADDEQLIEAIKQVNSL